MTDFQNADLTTAPTPAEDDALAFDLGGYTIGWRPSGLALKRAADRGVELGVILEGIMQLRDAAAATEEVEDSEAEDEEVDLDDVDALHITASEMLVTTGRLVWLGGLHFEPDLSLEAILALLDLHSVEDLPLEAMAARILPKIEDELEGEKASDALGKAQGAGSTS